jgi:hypothetical protein
MPDQNNQFCIAYGDAMFYAHLIEDLVLLHITECGHFQVNDYKGLTRTEIKSLTHNLAIKELGKIYNGNTEGSINLLVSSLDLLNKIRNKLTHAFMPQVGSDIESEEGREQILGMLQNIVLWEKRYLGFLQKHHEILISEIIRNHPEKIMTRENPPFDAHVARSKIQGYLSELSNYHQSK